MIIHNLRCRTAKDIGLKFVISTDAHTPGGFLKRR